MIDAAISIRFEKCEAEIVDALRAYRIHPDHASHAETLRAIDGYVDAMRDAGYTAEYVVIAIKSLGRKDLAIGEAHRRETPVERDMIAEPFISGAIRRFFRSHSAPSETDRSSSRLQT